MNMCERIQYWDNLKGVLIFLVVFAHFLLKSEQYHVRILVDAIYMFHMPAFVFISGFFGKSEHSRSSSSILKLLAAYILFNGLSSIIFNNYSVLVPFQIYWYILALIVYRLSIPWIAQFKGCLVVLTTISILIGYSNEINSNFGLSSIILFAPFYLAGYLMSIKNAKNGMICKSCRRIVLGLLAIELAVLIGLISYNIMDIVGEMVGVAIGRCCLILISVLAIYGLGTFIPNRTIPLLSRFGKYSLSIYLFHIFHLYFQRNVCFDNEYLLILVAFLLSIVTCILLSLPFIARMTDKLLSAGANLLKGNKEPGYYPLVVKTLFCGIGVLFLLHQPILRIIDYMLSLP